MIRIFQETTIRNGQMPRHAWGVMLAVSVVFSVIMMPVPILITLTFVAITISVIVDDKHNYALPKEDNGDWELLDIQRLQQILAQFNLPNIQLIFANATSKYPIICSGEATHGQLYILVKPQFNALEDAEAEMIFAHEIGHLQQMHNKNISTVEKMVSFFNLVSMGLAVLQPSLKTFLGSGVLVGIHSLLLNKLKRDCEFEADFHAVTNDDYCSEKQSRDDREQKLLAGLEKLTNLSQSLPAKSEQLRFTEKRLSGHPDFIESKAGLVTAYEYVRGLFTEHVTVEKRRDKLHDSLIRHRL